MLMMCFFYCVPFAKGLFYALSPILILFSLFVLKRGIRQSRLVLRQVAFALIFIAFLKMFIWDVYLLKEDLLCGTGWLAAYCSPAGLRIFQGAGLVALAPFSFFLFFIYHHFGSDRRQVMLTPEQVHLKFWANLSILLVIILIGWLIVPWAGSLTVGHVPKFFLKVSWHYLAILNVAVLLIGFWKLEDCSWSFNPVEKNKKAHLSRVWTAKDTLGLSAILFLITAAFCYASSDVLSNSPSKKGGGHLNINLNDLDLSGFGPGFRLPPDRP